MRRLIPAWLAFVITLSFATIAAAQGTGRIAGEILDTNGKPYPDVNVEIKNPDTGQAYTTKTDKNGRFTQLGLLSGVYMVTVTNEKDHLNFAVQFRVQQDQENAFKLNLKDHKSELGPSAEEMKKREDEENKFKNMKVHFEAGLAAMNDSATLRPQLKTAPADQLAGIKEKLSADYQTAITELQQAEQGVPPKDAKNHALVWANLGQAYEFSGRYEEAANAFAKAIELQPQVPFYEHLSTNLTNAAAAQPTLDAAKLTDASAACEKAAAADPTSAGRCWKNIGIILSNKNHQKEAVAPLQKATQADPKDAQAWFLLGGALSASIEPKQEGEKMTYIIPPGTVEAYQKAIEAAPTGPYAEQAKQMLDGLAAMGSGEATSVSTKKTKKKS
ncbi:MAG: carboxypeptidase regulatory-like domain-containing protein [Candidatus Acidiferrales bacterium]